jgi:hypothetical protein
MTRAPVSDEELILFHYREGLSHDRVAYIEQELVHSSLLKRRYDRLCTVLNAADRGAPQLPADFEERVWCRLQARIHASYRPRIAKPRSPHGMRALLNRICNLFRGPPE